MGRVRQHTGKAIAATSHVRDGSRRAHHTMGRGAAAGTSASRASKWMLDPWRDFVLIVGAPFIILPALWLAQSRFQPEQIYLFVASIGAVGLPPDVAALVVFTTRSWLQTYMG